jgi:hypothetical protein
MYTRPIAPRNEGKGKVYNPRTDNASSRVSASIRSRGLLEPPWSSTWSLILLSHPTPLDSLLKKKKKNCSVHSVGRRGYPSVCPTASCRHRATPSCARPPPCAPISCSAAPRPLRLRAAIHFVSGWPSSRPPRTLFHLKAQVWF